MFACDEKYKKSSACITCLRLKVKECFVGNLPCRALCSSKIFQMTKLKYVSDNSHRWACNITQSNHILHGFSEDLYYMIFNIIVQFVACC